MTKLKDLHKIEKPREKLLKYGGGKLTETELLAILLRTGKAGSNVLEVAKKLLKVFPGVSLANSTVEELKKVGGVGEVKALEIIACFELGRRMLKDKHVELILSPQEVWQKMVDIRDNKKEHFVVFFLDTQNQLILRETVSMGTLNTSLVHPREVFEPAIKNLASHVLVAHNHPSGSLEPSSEDIAITKRLLDAGRLLGIQLVDHVIVTSESFTSLKQENLLT